MKTGVVQMKICDLLENNLHKILYFLDKAKDEQVDLVCFPEMALTGYNIELLQSQDLNRIVLTSLEEVSKKCTEYSICSIIGHPFKHEDKLFNRATVIFPTGESLKYDKIHPTELEKKIFSQGEETLVFEFKQKRFGIAICRDQNFYEIFKKYKEAGCSGVFILAAHFYSPKEARWKIDKNKAIPITRAVENGYFVFLANAVGPHLNMISLGHSLIVDGDGCVVCEADETGEYLLTVEI
ncbi:carbon-nitrogen hydrolase family protein [Caldicellulosiruptor sp. F32]|uniref:carbon-nitrogen hydrolase family protein n=1 Tax=Caldicellulosiruptor sp. F32 TaxID=1214564 RepID=UPI00039CE0FF|nr:carbon-nitrogen hydrolase family protein [Caldicellulosiruptor sp. F32]